MPEYRISKIYKIVPLNSDDDCDVYYGSTVQKYLCVRMQQHICAYKKKAVYYSVFKLFEKYGIEGLVIELVESYPCNSRDELNMRESYFIRKFKCVNKYLPYISEEELKQYFKQYYENNKDHLLQKQKQYYENNQEQLKQKQIQYRENNKERIKQDAKKHYKDNKEAFKQQSNKYYESNRESIKERSKQYYENNKDKIEIRKSVKLTCECGCVCVRYCMPRHKKSIKHQTFMLSKSQQV